MPKRLRAWPGGTVIVPFFNRAAFLAETVTSILRQRGVRLRLLLVDDGSTDGSLDVARTFEGPTVRCLRARHRQGKSAAVNRAWPYLCGGWVTIFDSDDLMTPGSLARRVAFLQRHPRALAVMGRIGRLIDAHGRPLPPNHPVCLRAALGTEVARRMASTLGGLLPELFVYGKSPLAPLSATLIRRAALERVGRLNPAFPLSEDREYLMRLAAHQPVPFLDVPALWYRVHSGNESFRMVEGAVRSHPATRAFAHQLRLRYRARCQCPPVPASR